MTRHNKSSHSGASDLNSYFTPSINGLFPTALPFVHSSANPEPKFTETYIEGDYLEGQVVVIWEN